MDRARLRAAIQRLYDGDVAAAPPVMRELRDLGAVPGIHVGRTDLTPDETVEWFAGQALEILESESWFAVNSLHNVLDKFVPAEFREEG